jgi:hypothetical protein
LRGLIRRILGQPADPSGSDAKGRAAYDPTDPLDGDYNGSDLGGRTSRDGSSTLVFSRFSEEGGASAAASAYSMASPAAEEGDVDTEASEDLAKTDVLSSVVSCIGEASGNSTPGGYLVDTTRMCSPDKLGYGEESSFRSTFREIGMLRCDNLFVTSMKPQSFLAWSAKISFNLPEGHTLTNNQSGGGQGFHDFSYVMQKEDDSYTLKIQGSSVVRNLMQIDGRDGGPVFWDVNKREKSNAEAGQERETRDFEEVTSSYVSTEIFFRACDQEAFDAFITSNNIEKSKMLPTEGGFYYIPEIVSADYQLYVAPSFSGYDKIYAGDDKTKDISSTNIVVTNNPLDNRLGFIAGSLTDAINVPDLEDEDKNTQIKYALINLQELIDSKHADTKALVNHSLFSEIIMNIAKVKKELSQDNQILLANFFYDDDFNVAVINSVSVQGVFIKLINESASPAIVNRFAGLSLKLSDKLKRASPNVPGFWDGEGYHKGRFQHAEKQSKEFESRERTVMICGAIVTGCVLGFGFPIVGATLAVTISVGLFVLACTSAYYCNSEKTMQKDNMQTIQHEVSASKAASFERKFQSGDPAATASTAATARPAATASTASTSASTEATARPAETARSHN